MRPSVIVALGATALTAVLERRASITAAREASLVHPATAIPVVATYHPSAVLRGPDPDARAQLRAQLLAALKKARRLAGRKKKD